jgi:RNA polymerase sigma-70 factor (ECF subfamily)
LNDELIPSFQKGVDAIFNKVFDLYWPNLVYFASKFTDDRQEAEDIVIRIFQSLWQKRSDFENFASIKAFLYIATKNSCLNYLSYRQRQTELKKKIQLDEFQSELKEETEKYDLLKREVENLTGNVKKVMQLVLQDLKNQQIAKELGISVGAVETYKGRGIKLLKERIDRITRLGINILLLFLVLYSILRLLYQLFFGAL